MAGLIEWTASPAGTTEDIAKTVDYDYSAIPSGLGNFPFYPALKRAGLLSVVPSEQEGLRNRQLGG
jgi:hypothetical protein